MTNTHRSTPIAREITHVHHIGRLILENSGVAEPHNIRDKFYDAQLIHLHTTERARSWSHRRRLVHSLSVVLSLQ